MGLWLRGTESGPTQWLRGGAGRLGLRAGGHGPSADRWFGVEMMRGGVRGRGRVRGRWPLLHVGRIDM